MIALAFDSERIISISGDNTVRYWQWGQTSAPTDKVHVLDKGETLLSVAKRYSITLDELMRWNGVTDVRQCFAGMKLIVRKADPDAPTDAEKLLIQKEKRLEGGAKLAEKTSRDSAAVDAALAEGSKLTKYNRVQKIATDIDFFSLGNRLFGTEKRQLELFPDTINPNENTQSLAGRFRAEDVRKKEELRRQGKGISDFEATPDNEEDAAALAWALKTGSKVRPRYFISADNEDEWGDVADSLAVVMLQMMIEYEAYSVVMEQKRTLRSKQSVIGRINARQLEIEKEKQMQLAAEKAHDQALLIAAGFTPLADGVTAGAGADAAGTFSDAQPGSSSGDQKQQLQLVLPPINTNMHHSSQSQGSTVAKLTQRQESTTSVLSTTSASSQPSEGAAADEPHQTRAAIAKARKAKRAAELAVKKKSFRENVLRQASLVTGAYLNSVSGEGASEMGEVVVVNDDVFGAGDGGAGDDGGPGISVMHATLPIPEFGEEEEQEEEGSVRAIAATDRSSSAPAGAASTAQKNEQPDLKMRSQMPSPRDSAGNKEAGINVPSASNSHKKLTFPPI